MKTPVQQLLEQALAELRRSGAVPAETDVEISINRGKQAGHGDFATNLAMLLAKPARRNPRELATALIEALPDSPLIERVEVAGPGFINFFLTPDAMRQVIAEILEAGAGYGRSRIGEGRRVLIEFVSANPTGPLHVGHGRGAAYGAALADLLAAAGYTVEREYYVNDAGRQMDILAASTWLRCLEAGGATLPHFPASGYRGDYVRQIAGELHTEHGDKLAVDTAALFDGLPADGAGGDKEAHIDALVARLRELGGEQAYRTVFNAAMNAILNDIRDDLAGFGVHFDNWFMESSLTESGEVKKCMDKLKADGRVYEKEGALWFRSSEFGDEKDRVVRRDNGQPTYFASDIAYHLEKTERGYDKLIDIWGADHHGYMARVRAAMQALDLPEERLDILLVQFAILYRGKEKVPMSTRAGEFVTLRELRGEVGDDAARFFYIMRRSEQHMDFDLELAKSQSNDNPVYYVQYAHARIASVFKQLEEKNDQFSAYSRDAGLKALNRLEASHETALLTTLSRYPEVVEDAAVAAEPHQLTFYVRELANEFHSYYNAHQFLVEDAELRNARLALVEACGQVLRNALSLIGVSAPDSM